jgi:hypothetical protein
VISGRSFYFDRPEELRSAVGLGSNYCHLSLNEFTDEQVDKYLKSCGWTRQKGVPVWIPSRPLLLGYLAARGLLNETNAIDVNMSPAGAWDKLPDLIYRREEDMDARIEAQSVRKIIERLASVARTQKVELGEFSTDASNRRSHPCSVGRETEDNRKTVSNPSRVGLYLVRRTPLIQRGIKACIVMDVTKTGKHARSNKSKHACIC